MREVKAAVISVDRGRRVGGSHRAVGLAQGGPGGVYQRLEGTPAIERAVQDGQPANRGAGAVSKDAVRVDGATEAAAGRPFDGGLGFGREEGRVDDGRG